MTKEPTIKDVLKAVNDLASSTMVGFERLEEKLMNEIQSVRTELKDEIQSVHGELSGDIMTVHSELTSFREEIRIEFSKLWFETNEIKERLGRLEKENTEEAILLSGDIIDLKSRVLKLERKIAKLKTATR